MNDQPSDRQRAPWSASADLLLRDLLVRADRGDLMAELVVERGVYEVPVPRPAGMRRGRLGRCFVNASRHICVSTERAGTASRPRGGPQHCVRIQTQCLGADYAAARERRSDERPRERSA